MKLIAVYLLVLLNASITTKGFLGTDWVTLNMKTGMNLVTTPNMATYTTQQPTSTCLDKLPDCNSYGPQVYTCRGPLMDWSKIYCRSYCGYCGIHYLHQPSTNVQNTTHQPPQTTGNTTSTMTHQPPQITGITTSSMTTASTTTVAANLEFGIVVINVPTTKPPLSTTVNVTDAIPTQFVCTDRIDNCLSYGDTNYMCQGIYAKWAKENCALYCGFCLPVIHSKTSTNLPSPTIKSTTPSTTSSNTTIVTNSPTTQKLVSTTVTGKSIGVVTTSHACADKSSNCFDYGNYSCFGIFEKWGRENCALYCGFCHPVTQSQTPTNYPSPTTKSTAQPTASTTTAGQSQASTNLPLPTKNKSTMLSTVATPMHYPTKYPVCKDDIPDCASYGDRSYSCNGANEQWARYYCNLYCGFCITTPLVGPTKMTTPPLVGPTKMITVALVCEDKIPNCRDYGDPSYACHGRFENWGLDTCYKYCGYCVGVGCRSISDWFASNIPTTRAPVPTTVKYTAVVTTPFVCADKIVNCYAYGDTNYSCTGKYYIWARENCARYCGFCNISIPTTVEPGKLETTVSGASTTKEVDCHQKQVDLFFLIDTSGSVGTTNFNDGKEFIQRLTQGYRIDPSHVQVGAATFSSRVHEEFSLNTFHSKSHVVNGIKNLHYRGGTTFTDEALKYIIRTAFSPSRGDRPNAENILVILTDGRESSHHNPTKEEQMLHNSNITTYAIGIGRSVAQSHLIKLTGDRHHIYTSKATQDLHNALWRELGIC